MLNITSSMMTGSWRMFLLLLRSVLSSLLCIAEIPEGRKRHAQSRILCLLHTHIPCSCALNLGLIPEQYNSCTVIATNQFCSPVIHTKHQPWEMMSRAVVCIALKIISGCFCWIPKGTLIFCSTDLFMTSSKAGHNGDFFSEQRIHMWNE